MRIQLSVCHRVIYGHSYNNHLLQLVLPSLAPELIKIWCSY